MVLKPSTVDPELRMAFNEALIVTCVDDLFYLSEPGWKQYTLGSQKNGHV